MKRKITITANGGGSTARVTIAIDTTSEYSRLDTTKLALDIADDIMGALAAKYRRTNIRAN